MTYLKNKAKQWDDLADSTKIMLTSLKTRQPKPVQKRVYYCVVCERELLKAGKYCLDHKFIRKRKRHAS